MDVCVCSVCANFVLNLLESLMKNGLYLAEWALWTDAKLL
jgi:hypothetical protein